MRPWLILAGLMCLVAVTQAAAEDVSPVPLNSAKPHAAKTKPVKAAAIKAAGPGDIPFSDPYAPPVGSGKAKGAEFQTPERARPRVPEGGFSFTAGRESPDAPFTGGLKFRF
ncbi:MAG: hypothetical protein JO288_20045 [Hyphomicrobiales bacterium]|nr:hypothetical protein [Hyphomicrobiales bacterium]